MRTSSQPRPLRPTSRGITRTRPLSTTTTPALQTFAATPSPTPTGAAAQTSSIWAEHLRNRNSREVSHSSMPISSTANLAIWQLRGQMPALRSAIQTSLRIRITAVAWSRNHSTPSSCKWPNARPQMTTQGSKISVIGTMSVGVPATICLTRRT